MLRLINRRLKWFPLVALLMLLIGCGGSSSDSTMRFDQALDAMPESEAPENNLTADPSSTETAGGNKALSMVGYLGVGQITRQNSLVNDLPNQGGENGASALTSLTVPTEPFSVNAYQQANLEARDACTRYVQGVAVEGQQAGIEVGIPIETLDGGELITIGGPNGSYTGFAKQPIDQLISYSNAMRTSTLPLPAPNALMAIIPGFQLPAIDRIELPDVEPIVVLYDSPDNVLSAGFRWVVGIDPAARVVVSAKTITANGEAFRFLCTVVDDGEFTAPDWALKDLRDITTGVRGRSTVRTHEKLTVVGDVMVVAANTSQYTSIVSR